MRMMSISSLLPLYGETCDKNKGYKYRRKMIKELLDKFPCPERKIDYAIALLQNQRSASFWAENKEANTSSLALLHWALDLLGQDYL